MRPLNFFFACAVALLALLPAVEAVDWRPVDEALLALDKPKLDPDADAEAVLWEVWVADEMQGEMPQTIKTHYVRVKIFTERGVEEQSAIDLASVSSMRIHDLRGRTIKPDGRIVELEKAEIFERDVVKAGDIRVRTRSFSMPNVEVGDVIEYQWREFFDNSFANNLRLYFDRDIPTWEIAYHLKQSRLAVELGYFIRTQPFNFQFNGWEQDNLGFWTTTAQNIPAFQEEPYMPPEDQVRAWLLVFYAKDRMAEPERFWREVGEAVYKHYAQEMKPDGTVKKLAPEIVRGATAAAEKVAAVRKFCIEEIRNVNHDRSGMTGEDRSNYKPNKKPSDALKQRAGTSYDINLLFGAMVQAVGLDARLARLPRRNDRFFDLRYLNDDFLNSYAIAVDVDGEWRFYDPASPYLPDGMLDWPEEGVAALVSDPKEAVWVQTPYSAPEETGAKRTADLELLPDGTLQGTVRQTYLGHYGIANKRVYDGLTEQERVERVRELLTDRFSTAEVTDIAVENADSPDGDFAYSYRISVPGYAARTGKRVFLQPSFFKRGRSPRFKTSERKHDIYFNYGWSELDEVNIRLPAGFQLEDAEAPEGVNVPSVGSQSVQIGVTADRELRYRREMVWGLDGNILYPVKAYPMLKRVFELVQKSDDHILTLIESDQAAAQ